MIIDIADAGTRDAVPLDHFWSRVVGAGRANEGLRAHWQRQLTEVVDRAGFEYLRFHGLFHNDMFVYREIDGVVTPSFHYVDLLFDTLLDRGIRPFVELGFAPSALARETATVFWWRANGSPPTDLTKWARLVELTVEHWVERYGLDEVRTWYFEVWNEPNLDPFFRGTRSEYLELYRVTVAAVRRVDKTLRVGGPATSNFVPDARFSGEKEDVTEHTTVTTAEDLDSLDWKPVWLTEFLDYCTRHDLPVDFISVHPYPTDWALDSHGQGQKLTRGVGATPKDLATLRALVRASAFPDAELHLTEWSSSSSSRDHTHDHLQAATFVVRANVESIGLVDSLAYWTFTDVFEEEGGGFDPFHGGFGMVTQDGIAKPTLHAYRFLHAQGDRLVERRPGALVSRHSATGAIAALLYHYPDEVALTVPASFDDRAVAEATQELGHPVEFRLRLGGLRAGDHYRLEIVDAESGSAIDAWKSAGSPRNLGRAQAQALRDQADATRVLPLGVDADGVLDVTVTLEAWSIALLHAKVN